MTQKLLALYGLKWNPFLPEVPVEGLQATPRTHLFCTRMESMAHEGGFALLCGDVGTGKSATLRLLFARLSRLAEVTVGSITRPQAGVPDFYRELGHVFGAPLSPHNRWASARVLREKWTAHLAATRVRPVLLIDEAQEAAPALLNELRLLCSADLDARTLLTVVLCGDGRLTDKLRSAPLAPLLSRIRSRLIIEPHSPQALLEHLQHTITAAGHATLMTPELMRTLCEHAAGNLRTLMSTAAELLSLGAERDAVILDEKLFFEATGQAPQQARRTASGRKG